MTTYYKIIFKENNRTVREVTAKNISGVWYKFCLFIKEKYQVTLRV